MLSNCRNSIGIELRNNYINFCKLDDTQRAPFFFKKEIKSPNMPGAVVIYLSELIRCIDSDSLSLGLCICLHGVFNTSNRIVLSSADMPHWHDVPLSDWLEVQTGKKVILENIRNCAHQAYSWQKAQNFHLDQDNANAFGAALLAFSLTFH